MSSQIAYDDAQPQDAVNYNFSYNWPENQSSQYYQQHESTIPSHFASADMSTGYQLPGASTSATPDVDTMSTTSSQSGTAPRRIENLEDALAHYNIPQKLEQCRDRAQGSSRSKSKRDQTRPSPYPIQAGSLYTTVPKIHSYPAWPIASTDGPNLAHTGQLTSSEPYRGNSQDGDTDSLSSTSNSFSSASFQQSSASLRALSRQNSEEDVTQHATDPNRPATFSRSSSFTFPQHPTSYPMESMETSRPLPTQMHSMYAATQRRVARSASSQSLKNVSGSTTPSETSSSWIDSPGGMQTNSSASSPTIPLFASGLHSIPLPGSSTSAAGPPPSRHNTRSSVGSLLGSSSRSQSASNLASTGAHTQTTKVKRGAKLSQLDRKRICEYARDSPKTTQDVIGSIFKVDRTTISKILSQKDQWLEIPEPPGISSPANVSDINLHQSSSSQHRNSQHLSVTIPRVERTSARFPQIEARLTQWAQAETAAGRILNDQTIRTEAVRVRDLMGMGHDQFKASDGWLSKYKIRACIVDGRCTRTENEASGRLASSSFSGGGQYQHSSLGFIEGQPSAPDYARESSQSGYGTEDGFSAPSGWSPYSWPSYATPASSSTSHSIGVASTPAQDQDQHNYQHSYTSAPNTPSNILFSSLSMASPAVSTYAESSIGPDPYYRPESSQSSVYYAPLPRASPEDSQRPNQCDALSFTAQHMYPTQKQPDHHIPQSSVSTNDMLLALSTIQRYLSERPKFCTSTELDLFSTIQYRARDYLRSESSTPQQMYQAQAHQHQQMYIHASSDSQYPHRLASG